MDTDVLKVGAVLLVLGALWVLPEWAKHRRRLLALARALRLRPAPPPEAPGPPIERIAADLRRIRAQIDHAAPGMPVARRRGWVRAYDDVLVAACQALDLDERLDALPEGPTRDLERERVERLLAQSGIDVHLAV